MYLCRQIKIFSSNKYKYHNINLRLFKPKCFNISEFLYIPQIRNL